MMSTSLSGKRILVTGGNGYIGSHTVIQLVEAGAEVVIVDNLVNSNIECLKRVKKITGKEIEFHEVDLRDAAVLERNVFKNHPRYDAVIHFAGLKAVGESVSQPLRYYQFNVCGALNLFELMEKYDCRNLVFSSSATVYGLPESNPISEEARLQTTNPYGATKLVIENICRDLATASLLQPNGDHIWRIALLRYFNPIGAHPSGMIGEDPNGIPNNLLPYVLQVAVGRKGMDHVTVHGNDWPTPDKTGVRDYIHVMDLAAGHLAALKYHIFEGNNLNNCEAYNLGTGKGSSVLEVIAATEKACGHSIPRVFGPRRPGDIAECVCKPDKAKRILHWTAKYNIDQAVADSWKWQQQNPNGFNSQ